jgi:hypothetical protein
MIEVKIVKDEDGHTYIIPAELKDEFDDLLFHATMHGNYDNFISIFSSYMRNPDEIRLFTPNR